MFRAFFIYLSKAAWARRMVTKWDFAWRAASRFISGEKLEDAIQVVKKLNEKGINATLDHLGEHTSNPDQARQAAQDIIDMLDAIQASGVRSNVSLKLSQIGMGIDARLCAENLARILEHAKSLANFVRIDMEDASCVDTTLGLYREMVLERGFRGVGLVIQAYLYRSQEDVARLMEMGTRIRLCKGAYKESPEIAYPKKRDVDANFDLLARMLMDGAAKNGAPTLSEDGRIPPLPVMATHDIQRVRNAQHYAQQLGLPKGAIEFQMLHGIRRDLQEQLAVAGYPVRIYVPFGTEWYPYYTRRLAERPANLWFFISNFFRR
ncbi:MAG: proline dehydrogenase family protein [Anaerolineales bacterium]|nr:proline dehydrogenase family protein [Anaerolineales bacterium]